MLFAAGLAFTLLVQVLIRAQGDDTRLLDALGSDFKGKVSLVLYALGVALAFPARWVALALYVAVALLWLIPDRRIETVHRQPSQ